jgi:hypothetical protein
MKRRKLVGLNHLDKRLSKQFQQRQKRHRNAQEPLLGVVQVG